MSTPKPPNPLDPVDDQTIVDRLAGAVRAADANQELENTDGRLLTEELPMPTWSGISTHEFTQPQLAALFKAPERLGPWRLTRMLGRGGMGEVWLAERCDGVFSKEVAVKLLRSDRIEVLERFRLERQVLAELDHPNIASLLDGGVTPEGLPYLVTEYIEGDAIDRWCQATGCDLRTRIALFLQVCDAVSYAHSQLVVHRDIKPSNILIDRNTRAHLLDFGIAKLVSGTANDEVTDESPHTPEFAAPEQVQGGNISVRTDVYSLGLLLYTLLTGIRPQAQGGALVQQIDAIVNQLPELPSLVLSDATSKYVSAKQLVGDLDTIILRAIQKQPQSRFASVAEMSDDLRRYAAGKPILSRRVSFLERSARFLKTHWMVVTASSVAGLAMIAGLSIASFQQLRVRAEQEQAMQRSKEIAAARSFVASLLSDLKLQGAAERALLATALRYTESELHEFPQLRAGVIWDIATAHANLGLYDEREALLQNNFDVQTKGADLQSRAAANCALATVKAEQGNREAALDLLDQADRYLQSGVNNWAALDCALIGGRALRQLGEFGAAEMRLAAGIAILDQLPESRTVQRSNLLSEMSNVQVQAGKFVDALKTTQLMISELESTGRNETNAAQIAHHNVGQILKQLGQYDASRQAFERSLDLQALRSRERIGANTLCALAMVEQNLGHDTAAISRLEQCRLQAEKQTHLPAIQVLSLGRDAAEIALLTRDGPAFDRAIKDIEPIMMGFEPQSTSVLSVRLLKAERALQTNELDLAWQQIEPLIKLGSNAATLQLARALDVAIELSIMRGDKDAAKKYYAELQSLRSENFPGEHPLFSRAKRAVARLEPSA